MKTLRLESDRSTQLLSGAAGSHTHASIPRAPVLKILNQTTSSDVPERLVGSATLPKPTLDVRRAPMMCTSLPSFSGATLWMLSGDTTSDSPSAREVAVFNARPCEQKGGFQLRCGSPRLCFLRCITAGWSLGKHGDSSPHLTGGKPRPCKWHRWN